MQIPVQVAQIKAEADLEVAKLNSDTKLSIANEELDHQEDSMDVQNKQELDKMMLGESNAEEFIEEGGQPISKVRILLEQGLIYKIKKSKENGKHRK